MEYIYLIYYKLNKIEASILRLRFLDVETNASLRRPVRAVCRILSCNVPGLAENLSDLTVVSFKYDILLCSETLVSDMRHLSELLVPGFGRPVLLCRGRCLEPDGWLHMYEMDTENFANPNLSVVAAKCWFSCSCCETKPSCVQSLPQP